MLSDAAGGFCRVGWIGGIEWGIRWDRWRWGDSVGSLGSAGIVWGLRREHGGVGRIMVVSVGSWWDLLGVSAGSEGRFNWIQGTSVRVGVGLSLWGSWVIVISVVSEGGPTGCVRAS